MQRVLFIIGLGCIVLAGWWLIRPQVSNSLLQPTPAKETTVEATPGIQTLPSTTISTTSVFVPYWADFTTLSQTPEDKLYYFGIGVTEAGVTTSDEGYRVLDRFRESAGNKETYLTVRMLDAETNTAILKNPGSYRTVAASVAKTARENEFDGVVLDLEVGLLALHIAPEEITNFARIMRDELKSNELTFAMTIYGDTYYRKRPYDVQALGKVADEIIIMAYDFTKSFGTPGPNFPLNGQEEYGYDFTTMIDDFTRRVSPEKLTVIFGMYGYEWIVDSENRPLKAATAVTLNQANQRFSPTCSLPNCKVKRDSSSQENTVRFTDEDNRPHVVWYEDDASVGQKRALLEEKGISSIGFWAYGYY